MPTRYVFKPLTYQSQDIPFSRWVTLFTLALAPLLAHILAGAPRASYLTKHRPKWHEQFVHYNPTSILWRYAAIADRRIRARVWDRADIAAANAIFWTSEGYWDGSDTMVDRSLPYCTHLPDHAQINLFSGEMLKTCIVTLQGVQTIFVLTRNLTGGSVTETFVRSMAVDFVFSPLSFIGLLRVFCALWLTDDFNYTSKHTTAHMTESFHLAGAGASMRRNSVDSLLDPSDGRPLSGLSGHRYRPTSLWSSRVFRFFYLLLLLFMLAMGFMFLIDFQAFVKQYTATSFSVVLFYVVFLVATSGICAFYFATGSTSTVIPCITTTWYKVYSAAIMAFALATFVISCVETRETFCGKFTSAAGWAGDYEACSTSDQFIVPLGRDNSSAFGIATTAVPRVFNEKPLEPGEFLVYNVVGTCLAAYKDHNVTRAGTTKMVPWVS